MENQEEINIYCIGAGEQSEPQNTTCINPDPTR